METYFYGTKNVSDIKVKITFLSVKYKKYEKTCQVVQGFLSDRETIWTKKIRLR